LRLTTAAQAGPHDRCLQRALLIGADWPAFARLCQEALSKAALGWSILIFMSV